MSETTQNYKNHTRFDPVFHYFLAPLLLVNIGVAVHHAVRHPGWQSGWLIVLSVVLFVMLLFRGYSLKVQDRIIRLEERLRLMMLLPEDGRGWISELTVQQLVALRFASNAELVPLAERALREKLTPKQIKQAIVTWRPDTHRV